MSRAQPAALVLAFVAAACGGDDGEADGDDPAAVDGAVADAAPLPREQIAVSRMLIGSDFAEAALQGGPADRAVLHVNATASHLAWDLHAHLATGSVVAVKRTGEATIDYDFIPGQQAKWNLFVRNTDAVEPLELTGTIDLYGAMTWTTWD